MRNKTGQSEYVGMSLLFLAIVIFALVSRLGSQQSAASQSVILTSELSEAYVNVNAQTVLYSTADGIPTNELIGDYICYGDKNPDYGNGPIDLEREIQQRLDTYYGQDRWMLSINATTTTTTVPQIVIVMDQSGSMTDYPGPSGLTNAQAVRNAISQVSPTSRIWAMDDNPLNIRVNGDPPANNCDWSLSDSDPGVTSNSGQPFESWANVAGYIAEHGPPIPAAPFYDGWPADVPKMVFVSSDERACSIGPTARYVDAAIAKAQAAGVVFYFLEPPELWAEPNDATRSYVSDPAANEFLRSEIKRFSESTGGKSINISSVAFLVDEIRKAASVTLEDLRAFSITSSDFTTTFDIPRGKTRVLSYNFPIPTPCTTRIEAQGVLFVTN